MDAHDTPPIAPAVEAVPEAAAEPARGLIARFRISDGNIHPIAYPGSPSRQASLFAIGVVKGGSTLLHSILEDLQPYSSRKLLPISRKFFVSGVPLREVVEDVDNLFQQPGYIFATLRWLPQKLHIPALDKEKKLLLVRDPRDMLVSAYYSFRESHRIPKSGHIRTALERTRKRLQTTSLDEFVRSRAYPLKAKYFKLMTLLTTPNLLLRRYEDIIFDKENFVRDIADFFEMDVPPETIAAIAGKHDVMPATEDTSRHIRQVKPRNFESKLSPATVEEISHVLRAVLSEFDYR